MPGHSSKKQSQRTKGNVRPSSSSHAAELLSSTGGSGFMGFGTGPKYVPASQILDDVDNSLDADFRMVLRKLTKRDATTKIKGLQEFNDLCQGKNDDNVKAVLPFWPRTYSKMVLDTDYRVREAAQHAMSTIVVRMRRNLVPYLKSLMGSWLLSQCDTYPTVASAAQQSFQAAFPPAKQVDALVFCKESIIEYLSDNLLKQTAQTLSDPKTTDPEDMKNKYNRVLTSSLLAVRRLLTTLPADQSQSLSQQIGLILNDPKFWKLGKSQVNMVKGAFYSCLAGICQTLPELSSRSPICDKMVPLILHRLADNDPAICSHIWEAALSLVNHIENCWKHVNVMKGFWPEIKSILENGCHGNAVVIGPNLLPLISRIPDDLFPNTDKFYEDFFACFRTGLSCSTVQSSISECSALVKAYMECAHYVVRQSSSGASAAYILIDQVLPVIEASFVDDKSLLYRTSIYSMAGTMLHNLEQSDKTSDSAAEFWKQLGEHLQEHMDTFYAGNCEVSDFSDRVIFLVRSLFYPEMEMKQKSTKVKFEPQTEDIESNLMHMKLTEKSVLGKGARTFVQNLTLQSVQKAHSDFSTEHLRIFSQLIELDSSEETISKVIQCCHAGGDASFQSASTYFVFEICVPWLSKLADESDSDPSYLIQIVCVFIGQLDGESVFLLLDKLCRTLTDHRPLYIFIQKLFHLQKSTPAVKQWVSSDHFGDKLLTIAEDVCLSSLDSGCENRDCEAGWRILTLVLSATDDGEAPLVKVDYIQKILVSIQQSLVQLKSCQTADKADTAVSFVAKATHSLFSGFQACLSMVSATDLLLVLLEITLYNKYNIEDTTLLQARSAWSLGIQNSIKQTGGFLSDTGVLGRAALVVKDIVLSQASSCHILTSILSSVEILLQTVRNSLPEPADVNPVYVAFCDQLMVVSPSHTPTQVWEYLCVAGCCPYLPDSASANTFPTQTLFTSLYNCLLLKLCSTTNASYAPEETSTEIQTARVEWSSERLSCLLDCVTGLTVVQISQDINTVVKTFPSVMQATEDLSHTVRTLVQRLDNKERAHLWQVAFNKSADVPGVSLCLGTLLSMISCVSDTKHTLQLSPILERGSVLNESTVYMLYSTVEYLTASDVLTLTEIMVARLLSLPQESITSIDGGCSLLAVITRYVTVAMETYQKEATDLLTGTLDQVLSWKEETDDLLLFSCDVTETPRNIVLFNAEVSRFLACALKFPLDTLTPRHWDFVMCSLVSWVQTLEESQAGLLTCMAVQCLAVSVCDLLSRVAVSIQEMAGLPEGYPPNLVTEWDEFFSESAYSILLPLYLKLHDDLQTKPVSGMDRMLLSAVCQAVSHIPKQKTLDHRLPPRLIAGDLSPLPDNLQTLLNHVCVLLLSSDRAVQISAFCILDRVMPELPEYDKEDKSILEGATGGQEEVAQRSQPASLLKVLQEGSSVMDDLLLDVDIESCQAVDPLLPEYHHTLAYLLAWRLVMCSFHSAPAQLRQEYAAYLQSQGSVHRLMFHLFRLMPNNPGKMFSDKPAMAVKEPSSSMEIQHLSCSLYRSALKTIPAMVRQWWKDQDRKTAAYVDKFTTKNVSHLLCTAEIQSVQKTDVTLDYISIKARPATREVVATYVLEEVTIEIVTTLPSNYPLGNISVNSEKRVGVSGPQWEKWLLQLNIFLQHQNGNIMDGLKIWKSNIDKRFEGVDDCMICFSVLHGTTFQLPRMTCKTCKKKYHSACLYKWFNTSHNCTCPLCRNLF